MLMMFMTYMTRTMMLTLLMMFSYQVAPRERSDLFYGCENESFVSDEESSGVPTNLDKVVFNAASPDEKAILEGCSQLGMKFAGQL